nr:hypothetical protein [Tanacetum cinerariifolium]
MFENVSIWRLTKRAIQIAQSKALSPAADEPASLSRDDRYGEALITVSSLDAGQDRENIAKTSAMPHESSPRVPSLDADEGNKIKDHDIEIFGLKAIVKSLEDKERRREEPIQEDAPITGGIIDIWEELGADKSTEKGSNDIEEMVNVLSSMEAANILSSGGASISTASVSPTDIFLTTGVPTVSGSFPIVSVIFTTASVVAREMEEEFARENQRLSEQAARDSKIARIHTEEELKLMIEGLDRNNEQFDREDLHQLWILVKETFSIRQCTRDKEKELWVELKRLFEPDSKNQLWTYHQAFMHDPLDWKLFDTCGVHHASTKNQEIFIIVENDYPLRKGLAIVMIVQDEELFEESSPGEHLIQET